MANGTHGRDEENAWPGAPTTRRSLRLPTYDYRQAGGYFLTICVRDRQPLLGQVAGGAMTLSPAGQIAQHLWISLPARFAGVTLDASVVMPNHVHGIVLLPDGGTYSLGEVVRTYKAVVSRTIRRDLHLDFAWQQNYYEHIIRTPESLERIREYIVTNPLKWHLDHENPEYRSS